jgi:hypothetical protein
MPTLHPIQISSSWYAQHAVALCCSHSAAAAAAAMLALHRTPCAMLMQCQQSHTSPRSDHVALNPTSLRGQTMSTAPNGVVPQRNVEKGFGQGFGCLGVYLYLRNVEKVGSRIPLVQWRKQMGLLWSTHLSLHPRNLSVCCALRTVARFAGCCQFADVGWRPCLCVRPCLNLLMLGGVHVRARQNTGGATGGKHNRGAGAGSGALSSRRSHVLRDCS